jgi:hypothetical protein
MSREEINGARVVTKIRIEGKRGRGKQKRRLGTTENDMRAIGMCVGHVEIKISGDLI